MITDYYKIYLGLNDKDTKKQKFSIDEAVEIISGSGFSLTILPAYGTYQHLDGTIVKEQTLVIELYDVPVSMVKAFAKALCSTFNQESVLFYDMKNNCGEFLTKDRSLNNEHK